MSEILLNVGLIVRLSLNISMRVVHSDAQILFISQVFTILSYGSLQVALLFCL